MTLAVRSLASGSNGNSVLVQAASGAVLVDAGLSLPKHLSLSVDHGLDYSL